MAETDPSEPVILNAGHISPTSASVPILTGSSKATPTTRRASIVVGRYQGTVVVTVHGELDLTNSAALGAVLADLIDGQGNLSVVVDLHDATASDADSLSVFTEAAERAHRRGCKLKLSEPPDPIHSALQLRGLDDFVGRFLDGGGV